MAKVAWLARCSDILLVVTGNAVEALAKAKYI